MHNFIIQISDAPVSEEQRIDDFDLHNDTLLESRSDYYGDDRNNERPRAVGVLRELLADFAEVSDEGEISVFTEPEKKEYARLVFNQWLNDTCVKPDRTSVSLLRIQLEDFRMTPVIIALCFSQADGSMIGPTCKNSADFVEDILYGHLPDKLYVGSILGYHV